MHKKTGLFVVILLVIGYLANSKSPSSPSVSASEQCNRLSVIQDICFLTVRATVLLAAGKGMPSDFDSVVTQSIGTCHPAHVGLAMAEGGKGIGLLAADRITSGQLSSREQIIDFCTSSGIELLKMLDAKTKNSKGQ